MDDDAVNTLVTYLSHSNRKEHVETVMEMVRELAKYKHELAETRNRECQATDRLDMMAREMNGYEDPRFNRHNPGIMQLPVGTRSVEVHF